jgi:hypothetical protein
VFVRGKEEGSVCIEFLSNQPKRLCGKVIAEPKVLVRMVKTRKSELDGI